MMMTARSAIYGLEFDTISRSELEARVLESLDRGVGGWIITANLEFLRQFRMTEQVRGLLGGADLVVADGMPIVWASRIARRPVPERVAGSDLIHSLTAQLASAGRSVFLLGGAEGAATEAAARLAGANQGIEIAGTLCPPLGFERCPEQLSEAVDRVRLASPDVVYVGLGFPKQERVIQAMRPHLPRTWFVGCGVSIEFAAGYVNRAPAWAHPLGLEWLYRLSQEPSKLFRRYLVHGLPFALRLVAWACRTRAAGGRA